MTEQHAHTPGPWNLGPPTPDGTIPIIGDVCRPIVAVVRNPFRHEVSEQLRADARLIAAAPDLLATLEQIAAGAYANHQLAGDIARVAIAKATGGEA